MISQSVLAWTAGSPLCTGQMAELSIGPALLWTCLIMIPGKVPQRS